MSLNLFFLSMCTCISFFFFSLSDYIIFFLAVSATPMVTGSPSSLGTGDLISPPTSPVPSHSTDAKNASRSTRLVTTIAPLTSTKLPAKASVSTLTTCSSLSTMLARASKARGSSSQTQRQKQKVDVQKPATTTPFVSPSSSIPAKVQVVVEEQRDTVLTPS